MTNGKRKDENTVIGKNERGGGRGNKEEERRKTRVRCGEDA